MVTESENVFTLMAADAKKVVIWNLRVKDGSRN